MNTITAPNKYVDLEEVISHLGVSSATVKNWIKQSYLIPEKSFGNKLIFNSSELESFKGKIVSGEIDRLNKRANKRNSVNTFIPDEYALNQEVINLVQNIINSYKLNDLKINNVLLMIAINLLKNSNLISYKKLSSFSDLNFKNEIIKKEIDWWLGKIGDKNLNQNYIDLLDVEIPRVSDFLGLVYQSLVSEGSKAQNGSYYTPKEVVDEITNNYVKENDLVLDPCCGTGQFLLSASSKIKNPNNLWGFDIDEIAVRLARLNMILHFPDIDFNPNIYHKNTLTEVGSVGLFTEQNIPMFDVVITNPPWGVHLSKEETLELQNIFPSIKSGEIFSYFIKKGLDLLKKDGVLSFVLPESILNIKTHRDIREILVNDVSIKKIKYLDRVFKNVFTPVIRLDIIKTKPLDSNKIKAEKALSIHEIEQIRLKNNPDYVFNVFTNSKDVTFFDKIYKVGHITLKDNADWALGIVTGNNKKHLSEIKNETNEPILTGKEIKKFITNNAKYFINFNSESFQQVAPLYKYRTKEKLIYKFISKELVFSYDNKQTLTLNSANILIPNLKNYPIKTILALFNSTPYQFIYQKKFGSLKILKGDIEQLPLPIIEAKKHKEIEEMVNLLLDNKEQEEKKIKMYDKLDDYIMKLFNFNSEEKIYIKESIKISSKLLNNK